MNANSISTALLTPNFSIPSITDISADIQSRLLGQTRTLDAFTLLTIAQGQNMFLADQHGIERGPLLEALVQSQAEQPKCYLNKHQAGEQIQYIWQSQLNDTCIAQKQHKYRYLSGQITKRDLIGYVDNENQYHSGALADSQYLFICAESLWKREPLWELLFHIIDQTQYRVHSNWPTLPLQCKIILVGSSGLYSVCYLEERLFARHFPLLGELVTEIPLSQSSEQAYAVWLLTLAKQRHIQLEQSAIAPLFNYSSRLADHQKHLSLLSVPLTQLIEQASVYNKGVAVDAQAIKQALKLQTQRHNASQELSAQSFDDNFINLPTQGTMVGQINGLTVLDTAEYTYGEPARITASVHYGDGEVADIERKSELGGNIHAKGLMILSSCLYRIFGKDAPLHLNANIVFEQSYQEIDGDSASLAEYCALVSAIAEQAIDQGIAATGAIDQFGQVQAIGGVNEKIEGFFQLCQRRGLTGEQGVILPKSNVQQLNLHPDVIQAVADKKFHLYQVEHMDQAVEILMKQPAGVRNEQGQFGENSLYGLVQARLEGLAGYPDEESSFFAKLLAKFKLSS
ncbi:S16 family serine protease [Shewanella sp. Isolate11]|uniref:S16 family serine protease n=1 Tax=Shewanella sp. Isolate11 TaxID=2908530 RepID=UPI001EFC3904|nr:S16 family serine protease [Shewanella sp. Isolate11]MCG9696511.1 AAA family ATPase [Shewanella sp. Isolate11]